MPDHVTGQEAAAAPSVQRERLYTDREIGELIRLATGRQDQADAASQRGLSLGEVERIASEVGIDPLHVRAAAADLEGVRLSAGRSRLTGGPFVIGHRRIVEGTLSEADWSEIVSELRVRLGGAGRVEQLGGTWEWTRQVRDLDTVLSETQVRIRPNVDQTTIDVRTHFGGGATVGYLTGVVLGRARPPSSPRARDSRYLSTCSWWGQELWAAWSPPGRPSAPGLGGDDGR